MPFGRSKSVSFLKLSSLVLNYEWTGKVMIISFKKVDVHDGPLPHSRSVYSKIECDEWWEIIDNSPAVKMNIPISPHTQINKNKIHRELS